MTVLYVAVIAILFCLLVAGVRWFGNKGWLLEQKTKLILLTHDGGNTLVNKEIVPMEENMYIFEEVEVNELGDMVQGAIQFYPTRLRFFENELAVINSETERLEELSPLAITKSDKKGMDEKLQAATVLRKEVLVMKALLEEESLKIIRDAQHCLGEIKQNFAGSSAEINDLECLLDDAVNLVHSQAPHNALLKACDARKQGHAILSEHNLRWLNKCQEQLAFISSFEEGVAA